MRRLVAVTLLAAGSFWAGAFRAQEAASSRFAEVGLRILAMGERQPVTEVGTFVSSLPLGKPGGLKRALTITNETRSTIWNALREPLPGLAEVELWETRSCAVVTARALRS